jgi:tetratricopeptide (TPR) repeat protein
VPEFELNSDNIPLVTEICRLVGGMPLAIELAASWTRVLGLQEIIAEMREGLDFLETTLVDVPGRHRSLGHVFEYSWRLLSKQEKVVLAGLSCFRGGFDRKGAKAVAGAALPVIGLLVDKSLLHRISTDRFGIHEVTRQYAEAKLRENSAQYSSIRDLHSLYYIDYIEEKEALLKTSERKQIIDEMYVEIENIRSAWEWAVEHRRFADLARSTKSLYILYTSLGWFRSGEQLFSHTIDSLGKVPEFSDPAFPAADKAIAGLLLNRGWLRVLIGRRKEAVEDFEQSLSLFRRIEDRAGEAAALCRLSATELFAGRFDKATELAVESLECVEGTGDLLTKAMALNNYGNVERRMGNYTHAAEIYAETLAVLEEIGDTYGEIVALGNLGVVNYRLHNFEIARKITEESVALSEKFGEKRLIAEGYSDLANILREMGEMEQARKILHLCIEQNRELGLRSATGINIGNLAFLESRDGNFEKASELYSEMIGIATELGRPMMLIDSLCGQADIAMLKGDVDKAFEYFYRALEHAPGMPVVRSLLHILIGLAEAFMNISKRSISLDLLAFSMENSGSSEFVQKMIMELVIRLGIDPASDEFADACERARTTTFEQIVEVLLKERP